MAGEGYRVWTPGEVITADNIQQYLQDQAVQVYPSAAARGSALTGYISEGMMSYLEDTNAVEVYTGSQWVGLGGDAPIFTQGTSGEFLKSLGTAGVEWDSVPLPSEATPTVPGLLLGSTGTAFVSDPSYTEAVILGSNSGTALVYGSGILGSQNVIIGNDSAKLLVSGYENTIVGTNAAGSAVSTRSATYVGNQAGRVATGNGNTLIGSRSGQVVTTGEDNVVVGASALATISSSGSNNTLVGTLSSFSQAVNGNNNTLIGYQAIASSSSVSNEITLGNSSISTIRAQVTSITSLSDARDKTDIEELPVGLDFVNKLNPVKFTWNMRSPEPVTLPDGEVIEVDESSLKRGVEDFGFIAQDLVAAEDELEAHDWLQLSYRSNPEKLEVTQGRLIPILVKAIQELSARVEALEANQA
jgi:hypothetical protein